MSTDNKIWDLAEGYAAGTLSAAEHYAVEQRLATDPVFKTEFTECLNFQRSLIGSGAQARFRSMLQDVAQEAKAAKPVGRTISLITHYWRTAAVAAGIALLTSFSTFWIFNHSDKKGNSSQYSLLRRELETIKRSQNELIKDINTKPAEVSTPVAVARYEGTGFALTNDGYIVTSYHVTDGADSIYIQDHDGRYFKANLVHFDAATDVALLKVEKRSFRFSKADVPYTFATGKSSIGSQVYTLGFPQDDIVYNEGYICSRNGFQGDTMQYRLDITADPGQSGAPVIDNKGNLVALIAAKGPQNEGATYAVSSRAVLQLVKSLSKDINLRLPKANKLSKLSREEQIEKLQLYTCSVKVYKK